MALATMVCVAELMTHGSSSCGQTRGEVYQEKEPTEDVAAHQDLRDGRRAGGGGAGHHHSGAEEEGGQGVDPGGGGCSQEAHYCQVLCKTIELLADKR